MRIVTAANKRILHLDRCASVTDVSFDQKDVIVTLKLRKRRRRICSVCGQTGRHLEIVDYRTKRWRHLDRVGRPETFGPEGRGRGPSGEDAGSDV